MTWTPETVKEHFDTIIHSLRRELGYHYDQRFTDSKIFLDHALAELQRATDLAGINQQNVNATQNEFRGQLRDQAAQLMPRAEADGRYASARAESEQRFAEIAARFAALQSGWHDRFIGAQKAIDDNFIVIRKSIDELRRLVYIGLGLVLAFEFLYPLIHK